MEQHYRLLISCPDTTGIVAAVSNFIAQRNGWLSEASYHSDHDSGQFFMRNEILSSSLTVQKSDFETAFGALAEQFNMRWRLSDSMQKKRIVIMASHHSHCLADILHRWQSQDLDCEVVAVISNHRAVAHIADWYQLPFHYLDMTSENKIASNKQLEMLLDDYRSDCIVLARYMQIIPAVLCEKYQGAMINIHHSFLPSFVGANPYQHALDRGVKLIGATCHYVTPELDEGPIIEQDVVRVSHRYNIHEMRKKGKDVERTVLARGLQYHLEDRVMIHGNKTIILD